MCVCVEGMHVCTHIHCAYTHLCNVIEGTIVCVYAHLYCICTECMLYLCLFVLVSIVQVNYVIKTAFLERHFTIKNQESFTPGVVVLPRKLFCCCIHKR